MVNVLKYKEPRIIAENDILAEEIEKKMLEKYYHKKFKTDVKSAR